MQPAGTGRVCPGSLRGEAVKFGATGHGAWQDGSMSVNIGRGRHTAIIRDPVNNVRS